MNATVKIDAARVELLLSELRLPGIKLIWAALAETADKEGWPAARFLAALAEQEMVERSRRRFERHLEEARLPPGKTLDAFDFDAVPMISKAQVQALAAGDAWLEKGANLLCFGPPGGGKSHLAAAIDAHHRQSTIRRMGQNLPGSSHDPRGHRSPRPPRHDPRNECRQLSAKSGCRQSARSGTSANARDNQWLIVIVAPRQSNHASRKYRLRYRRAATIILSPRPPKWLS
jgi:hypothetical protein